MTLSRKKLISVGLVFMLVFMLLVSGCGVKPNDETKQKILKKLPPQIQPVSDFRFLDSGGSKLSFEFRASNGELWKGTYDGRYISAEPKD